MSASLRFSNGYTVAVVALLLTGCGGGGGSDSSPNPASATSDNPQPSTTTNDTSSNQPNPQTTAQAIPPLNTTANAPICEVIEEDGATIARNCNDFARFTPDVEFGTYRGVTEEQVGKVEAGRGNCRVVLHPTNGIAITTYSSASLDQITSSHEVKLVAPDGTATERWSALGFDPINKYQSLVANDVRQSRLGLFTFSPNTAGSDNKIALIVTTDEKDPFDLGCGSLVKE